MVSLYNNYTEAYKSRLTPSGKQNVLLQKPVSLPIKQLSIVRNHFDQTLR